MSDEAFSTKKLLVLRKLTRAVADLLRNQMTEYLTVLGPLLRPRGTLGDFVSGGVKEPVPGAEKAFRDLQSTYEALAGAKLFNLPKELKPPLEVSSALLEMTPVECVHAAKTDKETKTVTVTSPLRWVLSYSGFGPRRLKELLAEKNRTTNELQEFVLHALMLHAVVTRQTGVGRLLEALHFPVSTGKRAEFGDLPITYIASAIATIRPPDEVIIESTEIAGTDLFEEVVNLGDVARMTDSLRERLVQLVKGHGEELPPA